MQKFGQHFLVNKEKMRIIIDALEIKDRDTIIEIGAGHGELTLPLAKRFQDYKLQDCKIVAIEKDKALAKNLEYRIQNLGINNIKIVYGDVLKILPQIPVSYILNSVSYKLVGNIPYYITGHLLRVIGELEQKPSLTVLTIQKEVAERIIAQPPHNNLLAASVQFWAKQKIVDYISRDDFRPRPKVESAIIKLETRDTRQATRVAENYYKLIKIIFRQPRKTILNNLIGDMQYMACDKKQLVEKLQKIDIDPNDRAQNLSMEQIIVLSKNLRLAMS